MWKMSTGKSAFSFPRESFLCRPLDKEKTKCYLNCTSTVSTVGRKEDSLLITLNYRDSRPIYEQVKDELRKLIVSGAISDGEKLPSVRQLASQLAINPNTIQRAMGELEAEGYIVSVPGKGSFAVRAERAEDDARRRELSDRLRETAGELRAMGVSQSEIEALCREEGTT